MTKVWAAAIFVSFSLISASGQAVDPSQLASIEGKTVSVVDGQPVRKVNLTLRPLPTPPPPAPGTTGRGGGRGAGVVMGAPGAVPMQMPEPYAATSDAQGSFSFTNLAPGRYTLSADKTGYMNATYGMNRTASGVMTGNTLITLTSGQRMAGADLQMIPQSTISGKVTDEDGDPIGRVSVRALRKVYGPGGTRWQTSGNAQADDQGEYKITGLEAGRYLVAVQPRINFNQQNARRTGAQPGEPEMDYTTTYYPGVRNQSEAQAADVGQGQEKQAVNIPMRKTAVYHIRGKIDGSMPIPENPNATGLSRMQLMVGPGGELGGTSYGTVLKQDGTFDVGGLPPGLWTVSVVLPQGQMQTYNTSLVQVSNGDVNDLKLALRPPFDLTGTVRIVPENYVAPAGANGQQQGPRPRVGQVNLQAMDASMGLRAVNTQVQQDGTFTLKGVSAMRYRVGVTANSPGYLKSATLGGQDVLADGVDMRTAGGNLEIVYSMSAAEIDGMATTADGPGAANGAVTVLPDPPQPERTNLYKQGRTDASGSFSIRGVPPGKYRVYVWEDLEPGTQYDPDYMKPFESLGTSVSVDENGKAQLTLKQITKAQVADINKRAGR